jgi:uncharacterized DUF497 family protein
VKFEWNDAKAIANLRKHGVSFESAYDFEFETAIEALDTDLPFGEVRHRAYGFIGRKLHVLVYTERATAIRVISLRRATNRERRDYEETIESGW